MSRPDQSFVDRHNARVAQQRERHGLELRQFSEESARLMSTPDPSDSRRLAPDAASDEEQLHADIAEHARGRGWIALRSRMDRRTTRTRGEWDWLILADGGRVFFVECKRRGEKERPEQLGLRLWAERLGHVVHVVWSFQQYLEVIGMK